LWQIGSDWRGHACTLLALVGVLAVRLALRLALSLTFTFIFTFTLTARVYDIRPEKTTDGLLHSALCILETCAIRV
jgi:hypothetical protein